VTAVFVDSNILVYARDASEPTKQQAVAGWMRALWEARAGRLSTQVLSEFYVTVTGKLDPGLDRADARADVRALAAWDPLATDRSLIASAWEIEDRFGFSFWDALIVAAARRCGCTHLLTEDLQDGQDLDGTFVVDPFRHGPDSVLDPEPS
jgi:predicted nucleic acid-binding protein